MQLSALNLKREPTKSEAEIDTIISLSKVAISYWQLFLLCAGHGIYLDGESPSWGLSSQWSTTSRTPRVSFVRRNLKEGADKTATWRKETASEAGKSRMSVQHNTKSYWLRNTLTGKCGRYAVKEIWPYPGRSHEWLICHSNNESWEVSRTHSSEEVYVMYMERRGESVWSFK